MSSPSSIVIVGAGKVGYFLAKRLCQGKHTVSVVDKDKAICEEIAKELEGALGGPYVHIVEEMQRPLVERTLRQLERDKVLVPMRAEARAAATVAAMLVQQVPGLPPGAPGIDLGAGLGRGHEHP